MAEKEKAHDDVRSARERRPYAPPSIVDYGSVSKLTKTGTGAMGEGNASMAMS